MQPGDLCAKAYFSWNRDAETMTRSNTDALLYSWLAHHAFERFGDNGRKNGRKHVFDEAQA